MTELKALVEERFRTALTHDETRMRDSQRMILESRKLVKMADAIIARDPFLNGHAG